MFAETALKRALAVASGPRETLLYGKALIRDATRAALHKTNDVECERLAERWQSRDCLEAAQRFLKRK